MDEDATEGPGNSSVEASCSGGSGGSSVSYVYSAKGNGQNGDGVITLASQGSSERPTTDGVYFKYTLNGDALVTPPEACIYREALGGELCLTYGDYENNVSKIKTYFKIDDEFDESEYDGVYCNYNDNDYIDCIGYEVETYAYSSQNMYVLYSGDEAITCRVDDSNNYYCD